MEFISKLSFYAMFGISLLVCLFLLANSAYNFLTPYGKTSESLILGFGGLLTAFGLYFTYQHAVPADKFLYGCGILGLTWLAVVIELFIGYFYFNGPINWQ